MSGTLGGGAGSLSEGGRLDGGWLGMLTPGSLVEPIAREFRKSAASRP